MSKYLLIRYATVLLVSISTSISEPKFQDQSPTFTTLSWNIQTFGNSKSPEEIATIASILKDYDIVLIQEVVAGDGGAQAIADLDAALDRTGKNWDYRVSDPTHNWDGCGQERYAYLWKTSRAIIRGKPYLAVDYDRRICREPYIATFGIDGTIVTFVNIHAIPAKSDQHPSQELKYLREIVPPDANHWIIAGDFNCSTRESVWEPLKSRGYNFILSNQRTTLRTQVRDGRYLANPKDNILYQRNSFRKVDAGIVDTYQLTGSLDAARNLSDHVPVWVEFEIVH